MRLLIQLRDLSLHLPHKLCFSDFSADVYSGAHIAIIGANGSGKSMLLKKLAGEDTLVEGSVLCSSGIKAAYVPQTVEAFDCLSGGERFNKALSQALPQANKVLILDEPTNHLDGLNQKSLRRLISSWSGALIAATHDASLIDACFKTIWHIEGGKINVFNGSYREYVRMLEQSREAESREYVSLKKEIRQAHDDLMREQKRAKIRKIAGEKKRDNKTVLPAKFDRMKEQGEYTAGRKKAELREKKEQAGARISGLYRVELPTPRFNIAHGASGGVLLQITNGSAGYEEGSFVVKDINISLGANERLALKGANGSGKSTILRAIMRDEAVFTAGDWFLPKPEAIGYLDQHYKTLDASATVIENIRRKAPHMPLREIREHLNDFLFRKNEETGILAGMLSGGEKARLSLALMALSAPALLILDEITNNVDLPTKEYIASILRNYPGAMLVVSHDERFLEEAEIGECGKYLD